jgi:hypothetical protein
MDFPVWENVTRPITVHDSAFHGSFFSSHSTVTAVTDTNSTMRNNWIDTGQFSGGLSSMALRR